MPSKAVKKKAPHRNFMIAKGVRGADDDAAKGDRDDVDDDVKDAPDDSEKSEKGAKTEGKREPWYKDRDKAKKADKEAFAKMKSKVSASNVKAAPVLVEKNMKGLLKGSKAFVEAKEWNDKLHAAGDDPEKLRALDEETNGGKKKKLEKARRWEKERVGKDAEKDSLPGTVLGADGIEAEDEVEKALKLSKKKGLKKDSRGIKVKEDGEVAKVSTDAEKGSLVAVKKKRGRGGGGGKKGAQKLKGDQKGKDSEDISGDVKKGNVDENEAAKAKKKEKAGTEENEEKAQKVKAAGAAVAAENGEETTRSLKKAHKAAKKAQKAKAAQKAKRFFPKHHKETNKLHMHPKRERAEEAARKAAIARGELPEDEDVNEDEDVDEEDAEDETPNENQNQNVNPKAGAEAKAKQAKPKPKVF